MRLFRITNPYNKCGRIANPPERERTYCSVPTCKFLIPHYRSFTPLFPCTVRCLYISFFSSFCSFCKAKRFFYLIGHITNGRPHWSRPIIMLIFSILQFCYMEVWEFGSLDVCAILSAPSFGRICNPPERMIH